MVLLFRLTCRAPGRSKGNKFFKVFQKWSFLLTERSVHRALQIFTRSDGYSIVDGWKSSVHQSSNIPRTTHSDTSKILWCQKQAHLRIVMFPFQRTIPKLKYKVKATISETLLIISKVFSHWQAYSLRAAVSSMSWHFVPVIGGFARGRYNFEH